MNLSKTDCENARPSSAHPEEFCTPGEQKSCTSLTESEDDEMETPTAEEPKEVPVQAICKEGVTPVKQQKPDFKVGKLEECTKTASAYKQLGQALRANNFPGLPIPMQTLSQETYTKEVSQKGLLEKSQNPHWHGKKTDDLGIWRQTFLAHASLNQDLQQYLDSQCTPARTRDEASRPVCQTPPPAARKKMGKQPPAPRRRHHRARAPAPPASRGQPPPPAGIQTVSANDDDSFWDFYDQPIVPI